MSAESALVRGPERFRAPAGQDRPSPLRSILAAGVLLLIIVGLPLLLLQTVGLPPVPREFHASMLLQAVSLEVLLGVLYWVLWLAWLQFTVCTVVEIVSAVRGQGMPVHVPLSGGIQGLVRRLVISMLLASALSAPAAAAVPALPSHAAAQAAASAQEMGAAGAAGQGTTGVQPAAGGIAGQDASGHEAGQSSEHVRYMLGDIELDPETGQQLVGQRVYVVQPPDGRYHDNLWDIAERNLGEGRGYQEIYDLNAGRLQPDGRSLELARLIQPGWLLVMPDSAESVERVVAVPVENPAPPPQMLDRSAAVQEAENRVSAVQDVAPAQMPAVGSLLAASLVALLARRRRQWVGAAPGEEAGELERLLRVGADEARSLRLDAVLRSLSAMEEPPRPYAVAINDTACYMRLSQPRMEAPAPWQVQDGGLTWAIPAGQEPAVPAGVPPLLPGLVTIGRDASGADILIDLAAADGEVGVVGDPMMAAEMVGALALELCTNPWSEGAEVAGSGLPPVLHEMLGGRLQSPHELVHSAGARETDGILTGRHEAPTTFMLVAGGDVLPPLPPGRSLALVRTGSDRGARWRIEIDASGTARIDPLGITVTATRATEHELAGLAELLAAPAPVDGGRPPVPDPPQPPVMTAVMRTAPVRIHILGETLVEAGGAVDRARRSILTEAAICVALHPQGIRPEVLGAMIWPLGVTGDVIEATVERLRTWLGTDADGAPHLRQDAEGRLHMGPGVVMDWDVLRSLLEASRKDPRREAELLIEALRLVRGPIGQGMPKGHYGWVARVRTARQYDALVVDAAHRLVELLGDTDPGGAAGAVDIGLKVVDLNQELWRDRLRLAARRGSSELERDIHVLMEASGVDDLTALDPATAALIEDLAPGMSVRRIGA
ncbi:LysM peptidoglycan-binding domain-containing protein [Actinomyces capricornis]|uniref:Bacterial transcriptional activator domain-containing protein n=1 Tax=Actinomyces capricornis TaxID=2755559 RepID=A0ABN6K9F1_9ACTO|nr:hypothetical protein [Actinomyces capricornis]BDA64991.1 hypothetical protein MANAM107_18250 [Actinomyces capricornis]